MDGWMGALMNEAGKETDTDSGLAKESGKTKTCGLQTEAEKLSLFKEPASNTGF